MDRKKSWTQISESKIERIMEEKSNKGRICVTGGTGFLGSWMVKRLLEDGYSVNITARIDPDNQRDISYLTNLPGASERLKIFNAGLEKPESFSEAIRGCIGVFHMAHPVEFDGKESEEMNSKGIISGVLGILQACVDSKTVKRVIFTSTIGAAAFCGSSKIDESCWTDIDFVQMIWKFGAPYAVSKTLTEKAAFQFAEENGLDLVSVLPSWVTGPFICPQVPETVKVSLSLILGDEKQYTQLKTTNLVHVDDVARAHIHLFEHPEAEGRYFCTNVQCSLAELHEFISSRFPEYELPTLSSSLKDSTNGGVFNISSKKLLETGFKFEQGLEEMYDEAIQCCKEKGVL